MDKIEKMVKTDVAPHVSMLLVRDESQKASVTFVGHNKVKMKNIFPWSSATVWGGREGAVRDFRVFACVSFFHPQNRKTLFANL